MEIINAITGEVEGRVQGVGYRYFVLDIAEQLGLAGWVRNLPDGNVEYLVQGPDAPVKEFLRKLEAGPPLSRVERVTRNDVPVDAEMTGFELRY